MPEFTTDGDLWFWTVVDLLLANDAVFVLQLNVFVINVPFEFLALFLKNDMIRELKKKKLVLYLCEADDDRNLFL